MDTSTINAARNLIDSDTVVFWFRRDLRTNDNAGLYHALKENINIVPLFIFDTVLPGAREREDARVQFILRTLSALRKDLETHRSGLLVLSGDPVDIFRELRPKAVYANKDYEPYGIHRDKSVDAILRDKGSSLKTFKDHVIFEEKEIIKNDGSPYTVYTPYRNKWKEMFHPSLVRQYPSEKYLHHLKRFQPPPTPELEVTGSDQPATAFPGRDLPQRVLENYHLRRDYPALDGTSRLGVHLRFGTVSIRKLVSLGSSHEVWLNELIWRDFYQMILSNFPHVTTRSFKPAYDRIEWRNDPADFDHWCSGTTGYPLVDAGMRELNATGFMHNRARMVTASFLTKHLLIDWRWGEAYFANKLLDFELASNNGGWQWAAGSGCDAAPYFRIFNPALQLKKFDPELTYCLKWIPELMSGSYPAPIVEHTFARARAIKTYKKGLQHP